MIDARPLVSDVSLTSDMLRLDKRKKKLTKTKHQQPVPFEDPKLKQLRAKFGVSSALSDLSSDSDVESSPSTRKTVDSPRAKTKVVHHKENVVSKLKHNREQQVSIQNELEKLQREMEERLQLLNEPLKLPESKCSSCTTETQTSNDNNDQVATTQSEQSQILDYIKRQDERLQEISNQLNHLIQSSQLVVHPSPSVQTIPKRLASPSKPRTITINQQHNLERTRRMDSGHTVREKKSIQTMTSFIADDESVNSDHQTHRNHNLDDFLSKLLQM